MNTFFVADLIEGSVHTVQATIMVVSEHAYWYVDDVLDIPIDALRQAASAFDRDIYPIVTRSFGDIWNPGVDNDPRMTILHTPLRGVSGYFGSQDEYPRQTHPHSNQREMIYMDGQRLQVGSKAYLGALAHELQHATHWNADSGEESWVNEGLSEVAKSLAGYAPTFVGSFLSQPATQLNYWPNEVGRSAPHYGAATLFMLFLAHHYGGNEGLKSLVQEPLDDVRGVKSYLSRHGVTFLDVFKDWVVANFLNSPNGPFSYGKPIAPLRDIDTMTTYGEKTDVSPQFAARYTDLMLGSGDATVEFQGDSMVAQVPTECHSGRHCWWGNRGDSIDSLLTRAFDLSDLTEATLEFWTWFSIEEGWDYAYVEVSTDDGATWVILDGDHTTSENPLGNSYGHGFTGRSGRWLREKIDLTPYVGQEVLVRFEYITDDSVYLDGFLIDDLAVPQLGLFDDAEGDAGWQANGFARIDNELPQQYLVQVIEQRADGSDVVRQVGIAQSNKGQILIQGFGTKLNNAVIIVSPVTPNTNQPAGYTITVRPAENGD